MIKAAVHGLLLGLVATLARLASVLPRSSRRPYRSLWAGSPIINMAVNARAERRLGVDADSLVYETYFVTDTFTYDLSRFMRWRLLRPLVPYLTLLWASRRYDRFHFYCDRGLLTPRTPYQFVEGELRLLRRLGKELFFWTYGADVRTRRTTEALGPYHCCTNCPRPGHMCVCDDDAGVTNMDVVRRYAHGIFAMGDMIEYTPGSTNDLYFWPVELDADEGRRYRAVVPDADGPRPLRVVHAPNHREFKGTDHLFAAVERLQADGVDIDLVLVERVPNAEALEIYRSADVIFDQCLIGFHGYLAQEAMALGKPVLCFIRRPDAYLLAPEDCPIINTPREALEDTLRALAADRDRLHDAGTRGRAYIERYHTPDRFAARLARTYAGLGVRGGETSDPDETTAPTSNREDDQRCSV